MRKKAHYGILFIFSSLMAPIFAQAQDIITKQDNTTIQAKVEEIVDDEIVYRVWDNQGGPIYRISTAKVKKIQFRNGREEYFSTSGQNSPVDSPTPLQTSPITDKTGELYYHRGEFSMNGTELNKKEIRDLIGDEIFEKTYLSARRQRSWGKILTITGACVGTLGTAAYVYAFTGLTATTTHTWYEDSSGRTWGHNYTYEEDAPKADALLWGAIGMGVGFTMLDIGIPLKIISRKRFNWIEEDYNQRNWNGAQLHVGATTNGIGIALRF